MLGFLLASYVTLQEYNLALSRASSKRPVRHFINLHVDCMSTALPLRISFHVTHCTILCNFSFKTWLGQCKYHQPPLKQFVWTKHQTYTENSRNFGFSIAQSWSFAKTLKSPGFQYRYHQQYSSCHQARPHPSIIEVPLVAAWNGTRGQLGQ